MLVSQKNSGQYTCRMSLKFLLQQHFFPLTIKLNFEGSCIY